MHTVCPTSNGWKLAWPCKTTFGAAAALWCWNGDLQSAPSFKRFLQQCSRLATRSPTTSTAIGRKGLPASTATFIKDAGSAQRAPICTRCALAPISLSKPVLLSRASSSRTNARSGSSSQKAKVPLNGSAAGELSAVEARSTPLTCCCSPASAQQFLWKGSPSRLSRICQGSAKIYKTIWKSMSNTPAHSQSRCSQRCSGGTNRGSARSGSFCGADPQPPTTSRQEASCAATQKSPTPI